MRENATDAALNVWGAARDFWDDFVSRDRWFKYKATIVACWLGLSLAGIWVAWPRDNAPSNTIGARLVRSQVTGTPVFMIVNESGEDWKEVVIEVNRSWQAAVRRVSAVPPDNNVTLEVRKLLGEGGEHAPSELEVTSLQVRTSEGYADLIVDGREVE